MNFSEPKVVDVDNFMVAGINVRTINRDEFNPQTAKLGDLWRSFWSDSLAEKTPNKRADSPIYGVYSHYDSDANGYYTVTAGVAVSAQPNQPELSTIAVVSGTYLVFSNKGQMPDIVVKTWKQIWAYFAEHPMHMRRFNTDFEVYLGPEEIAIYIGVGD